MKITSKREQSRVHLALPNESNLRHEAAKNNKLGRLIAPLVLAGFIACSCSDDPYYGKGYDSPYNNLYANKASSQPGAGTLNLTYSGFPFYGKEAYFEMQTAATANIKLSGILPLEDETIVEGVKLTATPAGGYSFSGSATSTKGTTFDYAGSVTDGLLSVAVSNARIPAYPFLNGGKFGMMNYKTGSTNANDLTTKKEPDSYNLMKILSYVNSMQAFHIDWWMPVTAELKALEAEYGFDYTTYAHNEKDILLSLKVNAGILSPTLSFVLKPIVSKLLYLVLPELTFHPDGNITAVYAPLRDDIEIMNLAEISLPKYPDMGLKVNESHRSETTVTTPFNLLHYFIEGNTLTLKPDLNMLMLFLQQTGSGLDMAGMDMTMLLDLYPYLAKWLAEGIKFTLEPEGFGEPADIIKDMVILRKLPYAYTFTKSLKKVTHNYYNYQYAGAYRLYVGLDELAPVVAMLPSLLASLSESGALAGYEDMLPLADLMAAIPQTSTLNLGLFLNYKTEE